MARTTERSKKFGRGLWRGRGSSAHNQNKHLGEPLGARLFWFFVRHSASAPSAARFSNGEASTLVQSLGGLPVGEVCY